MRMRRRLFTCAWLPLWTACSFMAQPAPHQPVGFDAADLPAQAADFPNWPLPPIDSADELDYLAGQRFEVEVMKGAGGGTSGAKKMKVHFPDAGESVSFKVKAVPRDLDGINNAPRKEMAAYVVQRLFLDPEDYVVPTTFARCMRIDLWREHQNASAAPSPADSTCRLVVVALWLRDLRVPEPVYDEARFLRDPLYAHFLSNLNVLTYVIDHRDGRTGNLLASADDARPQLFAIDNGSTFKPMAYNYFVPNWNVIRVAAVRKETVDRLRQLSRSDLDFLEVVAQLDKQPDGRFVNVAPGRSLDSERGALRKGDVIQFGLTRGEIDETWQRIEKLIDEVDSGELPVF